MGKREEPGNKEEWSKEQRRKEELWKKYLTGKTTRDELEELEILLSSAKPDWGLLMDTQTGNPMPGDMAERIRGQLRQYATLRNGEEINPSLVVPSPVVPFRKNAVRRSRTRWMAAASLLILVLAGFFYSTGAFTEKKPAHIPVLVTALTWDSITNPGITARLVTLPDQTKIWLNKNAMLYVNKNYSTDRRVRLTGEGYFEVAKNEKIPFRVETGEVETLVLGTTFNIDNNPEQSAVYIGLVKGSVKVQRSLNAPVLLSPGQTAITGRQTEGITTVQTGVPDIGGWINGDLVFNQLPLAEALVKLGSYYGININEDPALLKNKEATAVYHRKESWQQVLQHLLFIYHLSYKTGGRNNIIITQH